MRPAARPAPTHLRKDGACSCASTDSWARNSAASTRSGRAALRTCGARAPARGAPTKALALLAAASSSTPASLLWRAMASHRGRGAALGHAT